MVQLDFLLPYLVLFFGTFLLVLATVPILSKMAKRFGMVDKPDKRRKLHTRDVPLIGGLAIFIAVLSCCSVVLLLSVGGIFSKPVINDLSSFQLLRLGGLVLAAFLILAIGIMDDRFGIRGRQKLAAQIIVSLILVCTGTWIQGIRILDTNFNLKYAFTAEANQRVNRFQSDLDSLEEVQANRIRSDKVNGLIDESSEYEKLASLGSTVAELRQSNFLNELVYNRLLALVAMAATVLWIVGAINSVNLIDGADGLAGTTTFIICLALAMVAFMMSRYLEGSIALSLSGAILGFLVFNVPPARIFLGDAGSMLIGMLIAAIAVQSYVKESLFFICLAPLALLFIPIFDSVAAFARRLTTGRSIYSTDRGHLHHMLLRHGLSNYGMLFFVGGLTVITATGTVLTVYNNDFTFSLAGIAIVIAFLVSSRIFGFAEFKLLCSRLFRIGSSFIMPRSSTTPARSMSVQLQGSKEWDKLWMAITEFAERHQFHSIKLDLNLPWLHESFHADWKRPASAESEEVWQTRLPLAATGRVYGRIEISGAVANESVYLVLMLMSDLLETMEPAISRLAEGKENSVEVPVIKSRRESHYQSRLDNDRSDLITS